MRAIVLDPDKRAGAEVDGLPGTAFLRVEDLPMEPARDPDGPWLRSVV